jgi:hypothetical protein
VRQPLQLNFFGAISMTSPISASALRSVVPTPSSSSNTDILPPKALYTVILVSAFRKMGGFYLIGHHFYTADQLARYHEKATENYMRIEIDTTKIFTTWQVVKSKDGTEDLLRYGDADTIRGFVKECDQVVVNKPVITASRERAVAPSKHNQENKRATIIFENSLAFKNSLAAVPKKEEPSTTAIKFGKPVFHPKKEVTGTRNDLIQFANVVFEPKKGVIKFGKADS